MCDGEGHQLFDTQGATMENALASLAQRDSAAESDEAAEEEEDDWFRVGKVDAWCSCITNPASSENERGEALAFLHLAMAAAKVGSGALLSSAVRILKQTVGFLCPPPPKRNTSHWVKTFLR